MEAVDGGGCRFEEVVDGRFKWWRLWMETVTGGDSSEAVDRS